MTSRSQAVEMADTQRFMLARKQRRGKLISARREVIEQGRIRRGLERNLARQLVTTFDKIAARAGEQYEYGGFRAINRSSIIQDLSAVILPSVRATMNRMIERFSFVDPKQSPYERFIEEYINNQVGSRIQIMESTTINAIREAIRKGVEEDLGPRAIAGRIRERVGGSMGRRRAITIARTETHSAASYANHAVAKESGVQLKKRWVSTNDDRTRQHHREMNGTEVGMDEDFIVPYKGANYKMGYAGDPRGGPANVINCRCVIVYFEEEDVIIDDPVVEPVREVDFTPPEPDAPRPTLGNFKITPLSAITFRDAKTARANVRDYVKAGNDDPRHLSDTRFSGQSQTHFGKAEPKFDDEIYIALDAIVDDFKKLAAIFNVPDLRGFKEVSKRRRRPPNASMGDAVMNINNSAMGRNGRLGAEERWRLESPTNPWVRPDGAEKEKWNAVKGDRPWSVAAYQSTSFEKFRSVMIHEFAHHVHQMYKINKAEVDDLLSRGRYRAVEPPIERKVKFTRNRQGPSEYSDHNGHEWFAENFATYFNGRPDLADPKFIKIIEEMAEGAYDDI